MMKKFLLAFAFIFACHSAVAVAAGAKDLVKIGSSAVVEDGEAVSNLVVIFGDAAVNGFVKDSAVVIGGDLLVGDTGKIRGDTVVIFGKIVKAPGAEIFKEGFELSGKLIPVGILSVVGLCTLGFVWFAMLVGFAIIFLLIAIFFTQRVGKTSFFIENHFWKSFYYGLVALILVLPAAVFLMVSVIGIPLVPLLLIILSAATLFGYAAVCQLIGVKFFRAIRLPNQPMGLEVVVGIVLLGLVSVVPVVGWAIKTIAWIVGLGATAMTKFGQKSA